MGLIFSTILTRLFGKKKMKILMVGLDAVGKTSILYKLKLGETVEVIPTIGYNMETLDFGNVSLIVWDVSAHTRRNWRHFYFDSQGLIFVLDSNNRQQIYEAKDELRSLTLADELRDVVVLILANKQDIHGTMSIDELTEQMDLNNLLQRHRWHIQPTSVIEGKGLSEGFNWLADALNSS